MKVLTIFAVLLFITPAFAETSNFEMPDSIKPNVAFWENIYSKYTTSEFVIHDMNDLSLIYEVGQIPPSTDENKEGNKKDAHKKALLKYRHIFENIASLQNENLLSDEEKRVKSLIEMRGLSPQTAWERLRIQSGQKDKFLLGLKRAEIYQDEMKSIFASYGVPVELTALPHVESSFDVKAYSKAGAAGLWQFTRSTGRLFMKITKKVDERRDPIKSTHAAAKLLKANFEALGTWPLAITAYNHGGEGMKKAVMLSGTTDISTILADYDGKRFGFASKNFYSEFLAALNISANPEKFFTKEELAGIIKGSDYEKIDDSPSPNIKKQKKQAQKGLVYRVKKGDTLGKIAVKHRVSLKTLVKTNNITQNSVLKPGQIIKIN